MKVKIRRKAFKKDLKALTSREKLLLLENIEELQENPTGHEKVKAIHRHGYQIFRMKIEEKTLNHRVLFDIMDGEIVVLGVMTRPPQEYTEEVLDELIGRRK